MFHNLLYPSTLQGKTLHSALILYLCTSLIGCSAPQQPTVKPPTTVARAMETRSFSKDMKTVLKASINALQDMDYTIDVLNSDIGLITASRTTEKGQAPLSADNSSNNNQLSGLGKLLPIVFIAGAAIILFNLIFGGDDDDDGDKRRDRDGPTIHLDSGGSNSDSGPVGPRILRYKVTINLNDLNADKTKVRVSASGEIEQDGKILSTGGIHEPEFFRQFFANVNKALFLEDQGQ
ncbi:MAG: hypothetical protein VX260_06725 [Candidatus Neomarinimicrobiota bacterium]|nr:hypothetical protein [Candidatus Neomarinimicrobiota bacterium]